MTMRMMRNLPGLPQSSKGETKGQALKMLHGQPQVHVVRSAL